MDTNALKTFAAAARQQLLAEITVSLNGALSGQTAELPDSDWRKQPLKALEAAVASSGKQVVIERLAYVWFNRLIAFRFLDVRGFTPAGVVSPIQGQPQGQPEILTNAKQGYFDPEVFSGAARQGIQKRVAGLLAGSISPSDPFFQSTSLDGQNLAFVQLLEAYCQDWAKKLPGMFEEAASYSQLVVPATLLSPKSVMSQAVRVLTPQMCENVEVIGWLYQFYISERKDEVFAGFKKNQKAGAAEIPPATQLFTPDWIVRYLVENSLGRLWMLNHPDSDLAAQMEYYLPPASAETDFLRISHPEEIKVIDPCVGSGHMLTYAFDLLYQIYEELGYEPGSIPALILEHNLVGLEIDPRAAGLAEFSLAMKAREKASNFFRSYQVSPHIQVVRNFHFTPSEVEILTLDAPAGTAEFLKLFEQADVFGSLIQPDREQVEEVASWVQKLQASPQMGTLDFSGAVEKLEKAVVQAKYLADSYTICVTNPPYLRSANMDTALKRFVEKEYKKEKIDLYAAFIERLRRFALRKHGQVAMVTMQAWMFLSSFEDMRKYLLRQAPVVTMAHLGARAFDSIGGEVVSTTAFVLETERNPDLPGAFLRLVDGNNEAEKLIEAKRAAQNKPSAGVYFVRNMQAFAAIPGMPLAYWLSEPMQRAFNLGKPLGEVAAPRQGLATSDNQRFLRYWHEVDYARTHFHARSREEAEESGRKWFPYNKGGEFRKWWGNQEYLIAFDQETCDLLGTVGNKLPSRHLYFLPSVSWSKVSSGSPAFRVFPPGFIFDVAGTSIFVETERLAGFAAVCNSRVTTAMLAAVSPTLNFEVGTLKGLPMLEVSPETQRLAQDIIDITRKDWDFAETSWDFAGSPLLADAAGENLRELTEDRYRAALKTTAKVQELETEVNREVAQAYGLEAEIDPQVPLADVTLTENPYYRYKPTKDLTRSDQEYHDLFVTDAIKDLVSYAVGCMFGRYSLDKPGLILADARDNQDAHLAAYRQAVGGDSPRFAPDADGVIPVLGGSWFEDDLSDQFKRFLKVALGEDKYQENLRFVCKALGVKEIADYFWKGGRSSFYDDHVKRYKKRPIYWLFRSPKGAFSALIYAHRYTPDTAGIVSDYLRQFVVKVEKEIEITEHASDSAQGAERNRLRKRGEELRKALVELRDYESEVLYPLASRALPLDLDDGVLVNYLKMGPALAKIGIERKLREVQTWTWPRYPLEPESAS